MSRRRHRRIRESDSTQACMRREQARGLIVWSCRLLAIAIVSILVRIHWYPTAHTPSNKPEMARLSTGSNEIDYVLVDSGETGDGLHFRRYKAVAGENQPVSVQHWTQLLASDGSMSDSFTRVLQDAPFKGFFLETKGVSSASIQKNFEFVLVNAPHIRAFAEASPDPHSFEQHFQKCLGESCCAFSSLGGDAMLVSPIRRDNDDALPLQTFSHLGIFVRDAPRQQVRDLWQLAAKTYQHQWTNSPRSVWLSTEGSGVAWLHLRLDSRPKYYHYSTFASET